MDKRGQTPLFLDRTDDNDVWTFAIYVDHAEFEKIVLFRHKVLFVFAGCGVEIQAWKDWISNEIKEDRPTPNNLAVCIINAVTGELIFEHGQVVSDDVIKITGSGASFAYSCYEDNSCAVTAIDSAKSKDCFSGGSVKYFDIGNQVNMLSVDNIRIDLVSDLIAKEGMVVYKNHHDLEKCNASLKSSPVPVSLAVANDSEVEVAVSKIVAGKANARAPFNSGNHVWHQDKLKELDDAIDFIRSM